MPAPLTSKTSHAWTRPWLIWALCALGLACISGKHRFNSSSNNHFAFLAKDLFAGRWTHPDPPPGYCSDRARRAKQCRYHRFDDWARAQKLILDTELASELGSRSRVWAMPCRTQACQRDPKHRAHRWWIPGLGLKTLPEARYRQGERSWFISFPPGPSIWFLVSLWLGLPMFPDVPLTWLLAATIPASLDIAIRTRWPDLGKNWSLALSLACLFATGMTGIAIQGQVWFLAQISFAALLSAGLACWYQSTTLFRGFANLCWGFAVTCRPSAAFGLLAAGLFLSTRALATEPGLRKFGSAWFSRQLLLGPLIALGAMAAWNWYRFGQVTEFGHHFLEIRWLQRIQSEGLFGWSYLGRNLLSFLGLPPRALTPFALSIHGLGWLWSTPWILWFSIRGRCDRAMLCAVFLGIAPALFYQNTGQLQVSYRFALDLLPLWVLAIAPAAKAHPRVFGTLGAYSIILHVALAWAWANSPGTIFGSSPSNWPFSS